MFAEGLKTYRQLINAKEQGGPKWFKPTCHQQPGSTECGYYVMSWMQSIVNNGRTQGLIKNKFTYHNYYRCVVSSKIQGILFHVEILYQMIIMFERETRNGAFIGAHMCRSRTLPSFSFITSSFLKVLWITYDIITSVFGVPKLPTIIVL
ncbi:hypothetical protein K1719_011270 [Acacia pycnantha]|nr:hypothetical protein K1719_011270 [Acacia pycnantha]